MPKLSLSFAMLAAACLVITNVPTAALAETPTVPPGATPLPSMTATPTPQPVAPAPSATLLKRLSYHASTGGNGELRGANLQQVRAIMVGTTRINTFTSATSDRLTFIMPASPTFDAGDFPISLVDWRGIVTPTTLSVNYRITNRVDREMRYAGQAWQQTTNPIFGFKPGNDCTNYVSQLLLARGWRQDSIWWNTYASNGQRSGAWLSSTEFGNWLATQPTRATRLTWGTRDGVQVGDVVQFNWDWQASEGNTWDHSAVISKVVTLPNGKLDFYYTAHTYPRLYGGSIESIRKAYPHMRLRFWHLS